MLPEVVVRCQSSHAAQVDSQMLQRLVDTGFQEYYARWALRRCNGDLQQSQAALQAWGRKAQQDPAASTAGRDDGAGAADAAAGAGVASACMLGPVCAVFTIAMAAVLLQSACLWPRMHRATAASHAVVLAVRLIASTLGALNT